MNQVYIYLLSPLHTGGTTQEGNLVGIAREVHTNLPYIPSSTIRGKLRATVTDKNKKFKLFGNDLADGQQLEQGAIWIGDAALLWLPVPSLSHGVIWISSPQILRRWARLNGELLNNLPEEYSSSITSTKVYLKDAIIQANELKKWENWKKFVPQNSQTAGINNVLVLPDRHGATLIQMSLWRQVKIKLDEHKSVDGGFRYEEAISPDTLMYFTWGITSQTNGLSDQCQIDFKGLLEANPIIQVGGQESLGRGFIQQWMN
ncbi:MAG: type III-B CRISPR module RAMP protein Cmr4 [Gomphosphaeria aponina SAG 52.96 = DSM 107014]|uniref:Type III-B CRISPR module RAMP protein Cmr4 n=1 Tax=Gomphosphaeria aponina SAG 52.96 = DSM 107014 TaxID=1521640 RepID=A0A941GWW7_9CHRO|nr:type III-B CRISPR module RAMP protein Cmr4 [Gomphosphaeria aponina SAG 52.96 = DSM 107014]